MIRKILLSTFIFSMTTLYGGTLSNKALFHRCYKSLTQTFPHPSDSLLSQVVSGQKDPIDACSEVLDKATFTASGGTKIGNTSDTEAKAVLRTLHYLHFSWFTSKEIPMMQPFYKDTQSFLDINGPALYYTRALFDPNFQFKNIFEGTTHYESLRTDMDPNTAPISGRTKSEFNRLYTPFQFAPYGDLYGVKPFTTKQISYSQLLGGNRVDSVFNWDMHLGGGILGSNMYSMMNLSMPSLTKTNGTKIMSRTWAMHMVSDFLCREIPAIRYEDTTSYIIPGSPTEFRRDGACLRCHVTIDRTSSVIRGLHYKGRLMSITPGELQRNVEMNNYAVTKPAESVAWSDIDDPDYYRRPSTGYFTYRSHDGTLVKQPLGNMQALGDILKNLDDTYICAAKRYYKYFTGVDANVDDIADPQYTKQLSDSELAHRNEVINLGKAFRTHQDPKKLIKDILKKAQFKESDFKLSN